MAEGSFLFSLAHAFPRRPMFCGLSVGNFHRLAFHWHMLFLGIPYSMVCPWETYGFNSHWHIFSRHLMFYILPEGNFHRFTSHWHTVFLCIPCSMSCRGKLLSIHFSLAHTFPRHSMFYFLSDGNFLCLCFFFLSLGFLVSAPSASSLFRFPRVLQQHRRKGEIDNTTAPTQG